MIERRDLERRGVALVIDHDHFIVAIDVRRKRRETSCEIAVRSVVNSDYVHARPV